MSEIRNKLLIALSSNIVGNITPPKNISDEDLLFILVEAYNGKLDKANHTIRLFEELLETIEASIRLE